MKTFNPPNFGIDVYSANKAKGLRKFSVASLPPTAMQPSVTVRLPAPILALMFVLCAGVGHGTLVLNQIGDVNLYNLDPGTNPSPSQIFTDFPDYSSALLEDFTVTDSQLKITNVSALFLAQAGFDKFATVGMYRFNIFSGPSAAESDLTGDVASLLVLPGIDAFVTQVHGGGLLEFGLVSLSLNIDLPSAGTFWMSVSPVAASAVSGQFFLLNDGATGPVTPGGENAHLANPGDGFGLGTLSIVNLDHAYSMTVVPEPTMASLTILGGLGLMCRRKRSSSQRKQS